VPEIKEGYFLFKSHLFLTSYQFSSRLSVIVDLWSVCVTLACFTLR